jgi:hypothetical protein
MPLIPIASAATSVPYAEALIIAGRPLTTRETRRIRLSDKGLLDTMKQTRQAIQGQREALAIAMMSPCRSSGGSSDRRASGRKLGPPPLLECECDRHEAFAAYGRDDRGGPGHLLSTRRARSSSDEADDVDAN